MYATMLALPDADRTVVISEPVEAPFPIAESPTATLEAKLDHALRMIALLQQRIESLDATLMRVLMR